MIIRAPVIARRSSSNESEPQRVRGGTVTGLDVIVIVEAIYNGPNNKALGVCKPGQRITVASGPYGQSLIDSRLVRRADEEVLAAPTVPAPDPVFIEKVAEAAVELQNVLQQIAEPAQTEDSDGCQLLTESGVNLTIAQKVWAAGFRSKEDIAATYQAHGTAKLTEISGVGLNSAIKLVRWTGIDPEVSY